MSDFEKLPADLPENWSDGDIVAPDGISVGLTPQHGYNYLNAAVNKAQEGVNALQGEVGKVLDTTSQLQGCYTTYTPEGGTDGVDYAVDIPGVTALESGLTIKVIPHQSSTGTNPNLNINGLGAKGIRRYLSGNTAGTTSGSNTTTATNWLRGNRAIMLIYNGSYWVVLGLSKPSASDLTGTVKASNGGTGRGNNIPGTYLKGAGNGMLWNETPQSVLMDILRCDVAEDVPIMVPGSSFYSAYGNGVFLIANNHLLRSQDGINWIGTYEFLRSQRVLFGNGRFIMHATDTNLDTFYTEDGISVSSGGKLPDYHNGYYAGAYGAGKFVILCRSVDHGAYSEDGRSWTGFDMPSVGGGWYDMVFTGNGFLALRSTYSPDKLAYSADGISWSMITVDADSAVVHSNNLAYGNGRVIAVANEEYGAAYSDDGGATWTNVAFPFTAKSTPYVAYGNGMFVAVFTEGKAAYSADGKEWTATSFPIANSVRYIAFGDGKFVAPFDNRIAYSDDGKTWHDSVSFTKTVENSALAKALDLDDSLKVVAGQVLDKRIFEDWEQGSLTNSLTAYEVFTDGASNVVLTSGSTIYRSTDNGRTWTTKTISSSYRVVSFANGKLFINSSTATQVSSDFGNSFSVCSTGVGGSNTQPYHITYSPEKNLWVGVTSGTSNDSYYYSTDENAINWTRASTGNGVGGSYGLHYFGGYWWTIQSNYTLYYTSEDITSDTKVTWTQYTKISAGRHVGIFKYKNHLYILTQGSENTTVHRLQTPAESPALLTTLPFIVSFNSLSRFVFNDLILIKGGSTADKQKLFSVSENGVDFSIYDMPNGLYLYGLGYCNGVAFGTTQVGLYISNNQYIPGYLLKDPKGIDKTGLTYQALLPYIADSQSGFSKVKMISGTAQQGLSQSTVTVPFEAFKNKFYGVIAVCHQRDSAPYYPQTVNIVSQTNGSVVFRVQTIVSDSYNESRTIVYWMAFGE